MKLIDFAEQYLTYHDHVHGEWVVGCKLQPYEIDFLQLLSSNRYTASLFSRQMHGTTLMATYIAHTMIFDSKRIGVISFRFDISCNLISIARDIIKKYIEKNPFTVKIFDDNKRMVTLTNGSAVKAFSSVTSSCSHTLDMLFIDQAAYVSELKNILSAFGPALSIGGCIHMISTPNGLEYFFQIYDGSLCRHNHYVTGKYHYSLNSFYTPEHIEQLKGTMHNDNSWRQEMEIEFLSVDRPKNKMIQFRLTTELYDKVCIRAHEKNLTFSEYLRSLIDKDLENTN